MTKQLIACFDIETTGLTADYSTILCAVVKPWMEEPVVFREDTYMRARRSENPDMVTDIIEALNHYQILVAHNGVYFDRRWLNTLALEYGLDIVVPPFGKMIDPVQLARKNLAFKWNSLEKLSEFLHTQHQKTRASGETWKRATLDGDRDAMDSIVAHCVQDTLVLEEVTYKMRRFIKQINEWGSA